MELLWQNGQVVMQSQNQRSTINNKKSKYDGVSPEERDNSTTRVPPASQPQLQPQTVAQNPHLFMQEDEMSSWLQYPLVDDPFCADLLYSDSTTAELRQPPVSAPPSRPPIQPPRRIEQPNFLHFSRTNNNGNKPRVSETARPSSKSVVRETTTVVDSSDTPLVGPSSRVLDSMPDGGGGGGGGLSAAATTATVTASTFPGKEVMTCEMSLTSSPGGSSASASAEPMSAQKPLPAEERKRKGREADDDAEFHSEVSQRKYYFIIIN